LTCAVRSSWFLPGRLRDGHSGGLSAAPCRRAVGHPEGQSLRSICAKAQPYLIAFLRGGKNEVLRGDGGAAVSNASKKRKWQIKKPSYFALRP